MVRCVLISAGISELVTFTGMHQLHVSVILSFHRSNFSWHVCVVPICSLISMWSKLVERIRCSYHWRFSLRSFWPKLPSSVTLSHSIRGVTQVFFGETLLIFGLDHTSIGPIIGFSIHTSFRPNITKIRRRLVKPTSISFHTFWFLLILISLVSFPFKCDFFNHVFNVALLRHMRCRTVLHHLLSFLVLC